MRTDTVLVTVKRLMRRRAFTLVELLTVVAIIAIVAAILFPVFLVARRRADHTTCAENLHQLGLALTMYANDHDGWVPPATTDLWLTSGRAPTDEVEHSADVFRSAMDGYVKNKAVWFCPSDAWRGKNVLYLGQRHLLTSYRFYPVTEGQMTAWPPRMQIGRDPLSNKPANSEDVPLLSDAVGIPAKDSDPRFSDDNESRSNHPDGLVNAIRHDLSLVRLSAEYWNGTGH